MIGNYVPRRCGIATFTADLTTALNTHTGAECWALAMNDRPEGMTIPGKYGLKSVKMSRRTTGLRRTI